MPSCPCSPFVYEAMKALTTVPHDAFVTGRGYVVVFCLWALKSVPNVESAINLFFCH